MRSEKWNSRFLEMARLVSTWSKDPSTKTGAVIVRPDNTVASIGFNGFPKSMPDNEAWYLNREEKYSRIVHCEMNALIHAREPVQGYTLYTWPCMSCDRCAVHMIQAGIASYISPVPTADMNSRWSEAFHKTREYFRACGVHFSEVNHY